MIDTAPAKPVHRARVLVADDDAAVRSLLSDALTGAGYRVDVVSNGMELLERLGILDDRPVWWPEFDVVVTDVRMPGLTGTEVLEGVAMMGGRPRVILITSFVDKAAREAAQRYGAAGLLEKPVPLNTLLDAIEAALEGAFP